MSIRYKYTENETAATDVYFNEETHGEYMGFEQDGVMKKVPASLLKTKILADHLADVANPHEVTQTQVGLSNVPNVTTNNQTPTYTVAEGLSALVSGEVLSTAFGKLAKGMLSVIAQLDGKSEYRGTLIASDGDLNTLTLTGPYTCYGTTSNVPSATENWFIIHLNSNVNTASAGQIAIGYTTGKIYFRNKASSTWSAWSTGVTPAELGYLSGVTSAIQGQITSKEPAANKTTVWAETPGDVKFPTEKLVDARFVEVEADIADHETRIQVLEGFNPLLTWADVQTAVRAGVVEKYLAIGDQIADTWIDVAAGTTYSMNHDVVHFHPATKDGTNMLPAIGLQFHELLPFGLAFSNYQAFFLCPDGLAAGTYYVEVGVNWGTYVVLGAKYQFTLTQPVPAGGQLSGFYGAPDVAPANWRVYSWASSSSVTPIETVTPSAGNAGTGLGTFLTTVNGDLNSIQRTAYGNNRWKDSAMRQWLNSDAVSWWTPQTAWDRCPPAADLAKRGFLSGLPADLLAVIAQVKVTTYANTLTDGGVADVTYDKIFLPSLEQMYINPQIAGEGTYWPYWKNRLNVASPVAQGGTYPALIKYRLGTGTAEYQRLRSASRGFANTTWSVNTSGYVYYNSAVYAYRPSPACVIC